MAGDRREFAAVVNLGASVLHHARNMPDRLALAFEGQRLSYADLAMRLGRLAGMLAARGIAPGDRVAAVMRNSPAFIELALAVSHVGAVFLPINFRLSADEVAHIVGDAEAALVFVDEELAASAAGLPAVVVLDAAAQRDIGRIAGDVAAPPPAYRAPDDLYRLMYTSGTTDRPKGVMHSYSNMMWKALDHIAALGLAADDRLLVVGPLYHVGAFDLPGLAVFEVGGSIVLQRDFDPAAVARAIEEHRITGVWMAPVMMNAVLDCPEARSRDLSSLRWCVAGGERSVEGKIRQFGAVFPSARFVDAYGLTESCSGDTFMPAGRELEKIGSVGRAVAHVEITIRDEAGAVLPTGDEGEICLRGPKVTKGYWRNPDKTAASFHGDWFRTGDVGVLDAEGFLTITDRAKDMIISGGENIASSEVERVCHELPGVAELAVVGLPDARWGERPVLVAVLADGAALDLVTVAEHCRARLAAFKVPRELHLRASLPRNPSGKILKRVLRDELAAAANHREIA